MQGVSGTLVMSAVASVFAGVSISFMMKLPAGYHQDSFWLPALISFGSGATITTIAYVLAEKSGISIWQAMALGAACGVLGAWGHTLLASRENNGARPRKPARKACVDRPVDLASGEIYARPSIVITPICRPRGETSGFPNAGSAT